MRIAVGRFSQETNTFSPVASNLTTFQRQGYAVGEDFDLHGGGERSAVWAFVEVAEARGEVDLVPILEANAGPTGRLTKPTFDHMMATFAARLDEIGDVDVVFLALHGAMAADHDDDPEGLLAEMVREHVGDDVWVVASTDHHACITDRKVANLDIIVGHRTQPHDGPDTGRATAEALFRVIDEGITPTVAMRKAPMITHQEQYLTRKAPMKVWFDLAREIETRPGVLTVSTYPMQPWLDVEEGGWASIVYTDNDPELADELAKELTRCVWEMREQFMVQDSVTAAEAVARADAAPSGIVVLSDTGDSMAGGSAGDSNIILAEMIAQDVKGTALVPLVDEPAVLAAVAAGEGATIEVGLGRDLDPRWGDPVRVTAEVVRITDGKVDPADPYAPYDQGTSALLKVGNILVGVASFPARAARHPAFWAHYGVDATDREAIQMVVIKTASNFQSFAPYTSELIRVDTAGHTQSRVAEFEWQRLPRPIFPLDDDAALDF